MPIPFTPLVKSLPSTVPFVGPETLERLRGSPFKARIGANESAFGMSQLAANAMRAAIENDECAWYADPESFELRTLLAEKHSVQPDEICVDAGIDTLLGLAVRMLVEPGSQVVTSLGAYPTFNYHVSGYGGVLKTVPYRDNHEDAETLLAAAHEHSARMLYLSNPDNPMGTQLPGDAINTLINSLPADCIFILDEAYIDFSANPDAPAIDTSNNQVMRFRTFSKAYGLAGMRIGYVIAHRDLITGFNKIRNHFGLNRLAQIAAAASLQDAGFLTEIQQRVAEGREHIYTLARAHNLSFVESSTNFVAVDMGSTEAANKMLEELNAAGIFIRKPSVPPLDRYLRVGVGTEREHQVFSDTFSALISRI
ncbi:MAG: aminotransferase class I/II-fold pyridoxal phosphate-dependent enzyme [Granulosicoccus sp.]